MADTLPLTTELDPEALDRTIAFRVGLLSNLVTRPFYAENGKAENLTLNEWRVVQTLAIYPDIASSQISELTGMHKMNISHAVKRLHKLGRVDWHLSPRDGRIKLLRLTAEGLGVYNRIYPKARAKAVQLAGSVSPEELARFDETLDRLIAAARHWSDG